MTNQNQDQQEQVMPKAKICFLSLMSGCAMAAAILTLFPGSFFVNKEHTSLRMGIVIGLLFISALIGIASQIRINLANGDLKGKNLTVLVVFLASFFLVALAVVPSSLHRTTELVHRIVCGSNLKGMGNALNVYGEKFDGLLPTGEKWCDLLIEHCDISKKRFVCLSSDHKIEESSYAFNEVVKGLKLSDIPGNTVILFETDFDESENDRWNQSGGPELLHVDRHPRRGSNILFANGNVEYIKLKRLSDLRWNPDGETVFPTHLLEIIENKDKTLFKYIAISVLLVSLIASSVIIWKYRFSGYIVMRVVIPLLSVSAGLLLGNMSQSLYPVIGTLPIGLIAGGVIGSLAGLCYCGIIVNTSGKITNNEFRGGYIIAVGMATGVICSMIVHLVLMIALEKYLLLPMMAGVPFGIVAGGILGMIANLFICIHYYPRQSFGQEARRN